MTVRLDIPRTTNIDRIMIEDDEKWHSPFWRIINRSVVIILQLLIMKKWI